MKKKMMINKNNKNQDKSGSLNYLGLQQNLISF
jgi:hypothetical protein